MDLLFDITVFTSRVCVLHLMLSMHILVSTLLKEPVIGGPYLVICYLSLTLDIEQCCCLSMKTHYVFHCIIFHRKHVLLYTFCMYIEA